MLYVYNNKLTQEGVRRDSLSFLDCAVNIEEDRSLNTEVYRQPTQCPMEHKAPVVQSPRWESPVPGDLNRPEHKYTSQKN